MACSAAKQLWGALLRVQLQEAPVEYLCCCCTGRPEDSGISLQAVRELGGDFPLFGVCMGHQCIGQAFGGRVVRAPCGAMHGKTSLVHHMGKGVLQVRRVVCTVILGQAVACQHG